MVQLLPHCDHDLVDTTSPASPQPLLPLARMSRSLERTTAKKTPHLVLDLKIRLQVDAMHDHQIRQALEDVAQDLPCEWMSRADGDNNYGSLLSVSIEHFILTYTMK